MKVSMRVSSEVNIVSTRVSSCQHEYRDRLALPAKFNTRQRTKISNLFTLKFSSKRKEKESGIATDQMFNSWYYFQAQARFDHIGKANPWTIHHTSDSSSVFIFLLHKSTMKSTGIILAWNINDAQCRFYVSTSR
jgi:hypothetical protein